VSPPGPSADRGPLEAATEALARAWNRLDPELVAPWLAKRVRYTSVDTELVLEGRDEVLEHLRVKMERIQEVGESARIRAELGRLPTGGGQARPCVISTQGDRGVPVLFLIHVGPDGHITEIELVTTDPDPRHAIASGEVPD